jgi:hypothetical protein
LVIVRIRRGKIKGHSAFIFSGNKASRHDAVHHSQVVFSAILQGALVKEILAEFILIL